MERRTFISHSAAAVAAPMALAGNAVAQSSPRPSPPAYLAGQWKYLQGRQRAPHAWFIDGNKRSMTTDRWMGKPILMVFWAQSCSICRTDMPRLDRAHGELTAMGIKVVPMTVGAEKTTSAIKSWYSQQGYTNLGIYADAAAEMQVGYALRGTPTYYLIDKGGFVVGYIERQVDWAKRDAKNFLKAFT